MLTQEYFHLNTEKKKGQVSKSCKENLSDIVLWRGMLEGNRECLEKLYSKYNEKLCKYGFNITQDEDIVYDTLQDIFFYIIKKRHSLSEDINVKAYLYSSFRRELLLTLKKKRKISSLNDEELTNHGFFIKADPTFNSINSNLKMDLEKFIASSSSQLSKKQKEIIFLHFYEGLTYKQIAEIMNFYSVKSARNLIYKAIDILSVSLKNHKDELFSIIILTLFI